MPVVCTHACGSHVEFVRPQVNGIVCRTGSVESLAEALEWIHARAADLPAMAPRCIAAVAAYSAEAWATRFTSLCERVSR